jgi:hypothetical protein
MKSFPDRDKFPGDGQLFPNLVREGLPTIQELSRGGSTRKGVPDSAIEI